MTYKMKLKNDIFNTIPEDNNYKKQSFLNLTYLSISLPSISIYYD